MTPAALTLFEDVADQVTLQDVESFCPNDPGYPDYVRAFKFILTERVIPKVFDFDILETISLTRWGNADQEFKPDKALRFRRFRIFTQVVGMVIILGPEEDGWGMGSNYLAISLLDDITALDDHHLPRLLLPVLEEMNLKLSQSFSAEEAQFYLLAQILLCLMEDPPRSILNELANQMLAQESRLNEDGSKGFLWHHTTFVQCHHRWRQQVKKWFPASTSQEPISQLREALLNGSDQLQS